MADLGFNTRARAAAAAPALTLLLALAGCGGSDPNQFPPACPTTGILAPAADVYRYDGRGTDITDQVLSGHVTGLSGRCTATHNGDVLRTQVSVVVDLGRGAAAPSRRLAVPYFVAVTEGQRIVAKQVYVLHVAFPPNVDQLHVATDPVTLDLPTPGRTVGSDYHLMVGFQLDPSELQSNETRPAG